MKTKGQKADYVELDNHPIQGLYSNKDLEGQVRYYYYYKDNKRISATSDLPTALARFFSSTLKPEQKLNQLKLSDCLTKYFALRRDRELSYFYVREVDRFFNQFIALTGKSFVHQITFQDLQNYNDQIYKLSKTVKQRPDLYINKRFASVRSVFKAVIKKEEYKEDLNKLIDNLKVLDYSKKKRTQAKVITKEQFKDLYKRSEGLSRLMLLLGLNAGYTPIDIVTLKKSDINFEQKTIQRYRHKTGIVQAVCLWDETIEAIKAVKPNKSEYLLLSNTGLPYTYLWWQG